MTICYIFVVRKDMALATQTA